MNINTLPDEERKLAECAQQMKHIIETIGDIDDKNRQHLNLPRHIADAYMKAHNQALSLWSDKKAELKKAIQRAELVSPGCSKEILRSVGLSAPRWMLR